MIPAEVQFIGAWGIGMAARGRPCEPTISGTGAWSVPFFTTF